jgi:hypothetical protein
MGTGRRLSASAVRFLLTVALIGGLVSPQAMSFLASSREANRETDRAVAAALSRGFSVKGTVKGLYPGRKKTLKLRVRNLRRYKIKVKSLTIRVKKPSKPGCKRRWLKVTRGIFPKLKIGKLRHARVNVPIKLKRKANDKCQGAKWPLKYAGTAKRL